MYDLLSNAVNTLPETDWLKVNLTLTFQVESGATVFDSAGNEISDFNRVIVQASVRQKERSSVATELPGSDFQNLYLEGRLINPRSLPGDIKNEILAYAEYRDLESNSILKGQFKLLPVIQNRVSAITRKLGQRISGELIIGGGNAT